MATFGDDATACETACKCALIKICVALCHAPFTPLYCLHIEIYEPQLRVNLVFIYSLKALKVSEGIHFKLCQIFQCVGESIMLVLGFDL